MHLRAIVVSLIVLGVCAALPFFCCAEDLGRSNHECLVVTLRVPVGFEQGDQLVGRFKVAALPEKAKLVVRTDAGDIVGSIFPFGRQHESGSNEYLIPVPSTAIVDRQVKLRLSVEQKGKTPRAPTSSEVSGAEMSLSSR
jgi:hypothetical protein